MRFPKEELFYINMTLTVWCFVVSARKRPAPEFSRHTVIAPHIYHGREKREITSTRDEDVSTGLQRICVLLGCPEHWNTRRVQKETELLNSAPTSKESALRLLSAPSVRFDNKLPFVPFRYEH